MDTSRSPDADSTLSLRVWLPLALIALVAVVTGFVLLASWARSKPPENVSALSSQFETIDRYMGDAGYRAATSRVGRLGFPSREGHEYRVYELVHDGPGELLVQVSMSADLEISVDTRVSSTVFADGVEELEETQLGIITDLKRFWRENRDR